MTNEILMRTTTFKKLFPIFYLKWNVTVFTGNNIFGKSGVTVKLKTSNTKAAKHFIKVYFAEIALSKDSLQLKVSQFTAYLALCTV